MKKNCNELDSIVEKYNGSWADVVMDIGKNVRNPGERMDLYIETLGRVVRDSSTIGILYREMKYARIEIIEHEKKLENMAITDKLTGLYNKRFFDATLDKTIARVNRGNEDASLIIADIDKFKLFNDNYEHLAGDKVLNALGGVLKSGVRESDVACRYGGDEFGIILPNTGREGALKLAYKLNCKVADCPIEFEDESGKVHNLPVNISVGADQFKKGDSDKSLIGRVDKFLYRAKDIGRNCVVGPDGVYSIPHSILSISDKVACPTQF